MEPRPGASLHQEVTEEGSKKGNVDLDMPGISNVVDGTSEVGDAAR